MGSQKSRHDLEIEQHIVQCRSFKGQPTLLFLPTFGHSSVSLVTLHTSHFVQSLYLLSVKSQFDSSNSSLTESIHIPEIHESYFIVCAVNDLIYEYIHITLKKN